MKKSRLIIFIAAILAGKLLISPLDLFILSTLFDRSYDAEPAGYIECEKHIDPYGWMDSTDYIKYKYKSDGETLFADNHNFLKVNKKDINILGEFYDNFNNWMNIEERTNEFDMKKAQITEGDYYRIENWWYGKAEQKDWLNEINDDLEDDENSEYKLEITPIKGEGRIRLIKTDDKDAVDFSLSRYYNFYLYDTESSTLYYLHNDT